MSHPVDARVPGAFRLPPVRLLRAQRRLRAGLLELLFVGIGLALGLALPRVTEGPTVEGGKAAQLLFTLGLGVVGVVTIVFSLLFSVVQWSASTFSPRLSIFRDDPLVWRTFAVTLGGFVFCITAGTAGGSADRVSLLVPITATVATLTALGLIWALQIRAFRSMQLSRVLAALAARGRAVIDDLYPSAFSVPAGVPVTPAPSAPLRIVTWTGPPAVLQQLDLRRLVQAAAQADALVVFRVGVGSALQEGSPLADIHHGELSDEVVRAAVVRGAERSFDQDPMLAIRLLADIALRALSPAVNDPATAVDSLDATEGLLRVLAGRNLWVGDIADGDGVPRVRLVLPTWEDYLRTAVEDLLPVATGIPMVLERIQVMLTNLVETSPAPRHAALLQLASRVCALLAACRYEPLSTEAGR
ncbi:DUF2254 family protein [Kribbella pittospori]|uniref:DUF2254 family protein n=1 Tax=Kribbella pittospori TaxID=722689 RepID=UPI0013F42DA4|nr:DUF2254 family protein [Kribbella pittospori]